MIEIRDTSPNVDVQPAEYHRLLGYPRGGVPSERAIELAAWARNWYAQHGRPWVYAREAALDHPASGGVGAVTSCAELSLTTTLSIFASAAAPPGPGGRM